MSLDDTTQFIKGNTMQLKDLFKPDQMGNIPIYVDTNSSMIQPCSINKGYFKYKDLNNEDILFTGEEPVITRKSGYYNGKQVDQTFISYNSKTTRIFKMDCVPATAENLLLSKVMRGL